MSKNANANGAPDVSKACWIDLHHPSVEEERHVENWLGFDIPTREEMQEIEASSRLYTDDNAAYMTATVISDAESDAPEASPVTFVLTDAHLITVRYHDPMPFRTVAQTFTRQPDALAEPQAALAEVIDAVIDRLADILERVQANLEAVSRRIFDSRTAIKGKDLQEIFALIGRNGNLVGKARDSLLSFARLDGYARRLNLVKKSPQAAQRMKTIGEDIQSLMDHATFLSGQVDFLLNAVLGRTNIEQTAAIKLFSVVAVVFMPPTLLASVYGMNFEHMPELSSPYAYPIVLAAMALVAVLPYVFFKRKGLL